MENKMYKTKAVSEYSYYKDPYVCIGGYSPSNSYEKTFEKFDDAVAAAKKTAKKTKEDVEIWSKTHVIQFPEPALEVVALADAETKAK